ATERVFGIESGAGAQEAGHPAGRDSPRGEGPPRRAGDRPLGPGRGRCGDPDAGPLGVPPGGDSGLRPLDPPMADAVERGSMGLARGLRVDVVSPRVPVARQGFTTRRPWAAGWTFRRSSRP